MRKYTMVSLVAMVMLVFSACAHSPMAPKPRHDPYWGVLLDARTVSLYPDSALVVARNVILNANDSSQLYPDSEVNKAISASFLGPYKCFGLTTGQGFVGDYLFREDIYIINGPRDSLVKGTGPDTLAHYQTTVFNPLNSPIQGFGDDPDHTVIWRLTLNDGSAVAPAKLSAVAEAENPVGDIHWGDQGHCNGQ